MILGNYFSVWDILEKVVGMTDMYWSVRDVLKCWIVVILESWRVTGKLVSNVRGAEVFECKDVAGVLLERLRSAEVLG